MAELHFRTFDVLTFDCYGTLIDWERGLLDALRPALGAHEDGDPLLERFARHEAVIEAGDYVRFRDVLARAFEATCAELGVTPTQEETRRFADSVGEWPAFEDSPAALARLAERFRLAVITNCDDDLFARSNRRLGVAFDWVVTAEQARSYKPSLNNFELAFETIGVPRERILHVAQSLYHDHVPAKRLGLATAWIDRRRGRESFGATPPASAQPDFTAPDLETFADAALA